MWKLVKAAGLDLRFGASTAITSVFLMAPTSALFVVLMFAVLARRGVERGRAAWLALLFGFGTPVFYRTAHLNHNMFLMEAIFGAFVLVWLGSDERRELSLHYQAKVALADGAVTGVEALLRWHSADLGPVSPAQFIPQLPQGRGQLRAARHDEMQRRRVAAPVRMDVDELPAGEFLGHVRPRLVGDAQPGERPALDHLAVVGDAPAGQRQVHRLAGD